MKNPFLKLIPPVLLFCFGVFCLYLFYFTNWFDIHPIWILMDFHLDIIFTSFIVSSVYYFIEVSRNLINELYKIEIFLKNPFENNELVMNELIKKFSFQEIRNKKIDNEIAYEFNKKIRMGFILKIFIYIDECYCILYLKRSLFSCIVGRKLLKKIEFTIENEFEKYQEKYLDAKVN